jgi:hypothetical protein
MNINVTKPFLPPIAEYQAYIEGIWKRVWLTNNGPLLRQARKSPGVCLWPFFHYAIRLVSGIW